MTQRAPDARTAARIESVVTATGRTWDDWLRFMDSIDAMELDHKSIATQVYYELEDELEQAGMWAQATTVAYEQHVGRRVPGQRSDGTFQCSASKATALAMADLMVRWETFASCDAAVADVVGGEVRVSGTDRRMTWRTKAVDGSSIIVTSEPKQDGAASLVIAQLGIATPEANDDARERWKDVVGRFVAGLGR